MNTNGTPLVARFGVVAVVALVVIGVLLGLFSDNGDSAETVDTTVAPVVDKPVDLTDTVGDYLRAYWTYSWQTDDGKWQEQLSRLGAVDQATVPIVTGPSRVTCNRVRCAYSNVTIQEVTRVEPGLYEAVVRADFTSEGAGRQPGTWQCTVGTFRDRITTNTCVVVNGAR